MVVPARERGDEKERWTSERCKCSFTASALNVLKGTGMCQNTFGFGHGLGTDLPSEPLKSLMSFSCVIHIVFRIVPIFEASPFAWGRDASDCRQVPRVQDCPALLRWGRSGHWRRQGVREPPGAVGTPTPGSSSGPKLGDLGACRACQRPIPAQTTACYHLGSI